MYKLVSAYTKNATKISGSLWEFVKKQLPHKPTRSFTPDIASASGFFNNLGFFFTAERRPIPGFFAGTLASKTNALTVVLTNFYTRRFHFLHNELFFLQ
jgi:hypothetical protein